MGGKPEATMLSDASRILREVFSTTAEGGTLQTTTTLTYKDKREGVSARGPWLLSIFAGGDDREYTTLDSNLASKVKSNDGSLFVVEYEERPPKAGREKYGPDFGLKGAELAPEGAKPSAVAASTGGKGEFRSPAQIIRTTAIEVAVTAFLSLGLNPVEDTFGVLTYAGLVEQFITEGIEEEPEA
jgi:hypothetical protein